MGSEGNSSNLVSYYNFRAQELTTRGFSSAKALLPFKYRMKLRWLAWRDTFKIAIRIALPFLVGVVLMLYWLARQSIAEILTPFFVYLDRTWFGAYVDIEVAIFATIAVLFIPLALLFVHFVKLAIALEYDVMPASKY